MKGLDIEIDGAVHVLINTGIDAAPYADILLEHALNLTAGNEIEAVVRCMTQSKGFRKAVPWLLSLFRGYPGNGLSDGNLWAVGNAIYTINCEEYYPDVISLCRERAYLSARQMLMGALARAKTDEAYALLVRCVNDASVRAHAIEGLGRFGRADAISVLESLDVQKGLYECKAKETALRRLRRKLARQA